MTWVGGTKGTLAIPATTTSVLSSFGLDLKLAVNLTYGISTETSASLTTLVFMCHSCWFLKVGWSPF